MRRGGGRGVAGDEVVGGVTALGLYERGGWYGNAYVRAYIILAWFFFLNLWYWELESLILLSCAAYKFG